MKVFKTALKFFVLMTVLTGLIYPLLITLIAQLSMPHLANGSLIQRDKQVIASKLIAQGTQDNRYFWPRPSAIDYDPMKPSGGSNLGPISQKLKQIVDERKQKIGEQAPPAELVYASGSGLDPHISIETAYFQVPRIAKARSIKEDEIKTLIDSLAEGKQLGFLGSPYVNVFLLNQAVDALK